MIDYWWDLGIDGVIINKLINVRERKYTVTE